MHRRKTAGTQEEEVGAAAIVADLRRRRLLSDREILDGHVEAVEVHGRNDNHLVRWAGFGGLFLKAPVSRDRETLDRIRREASVYELASRDTGAALRDVVPQLAFFDPAQRRVATTHIASAETPGGRMSAPAVALALAISHTAFRSAPRLRWGQWPRQPAWVLQVHKPAVSWIADLSAAQLQLIGHLQDSKPVGRALDALNAGWQRSCLMHGDLKWSNAVTVAGTERVVLTDWEAADWGDPMWDMGSLLQSIILDILTSDDWVGAPDLDAAHAVFELSLPFAQTRIAESWREYSGVAGEQTPATQLRAVQYCGARLLLSAFEWSADDDTLGREALGATQLAANILTQPSEAASVVFGMQSDE